MRTFKGVEELQAALGERLGHSAWRTIDQARVDAFADATDDHQWIHVDPVRAADGAYGGTVAHGFLTLALVPAMVAEVYRVRGVRMSVNYGADQLRFPAPVPVGGRIRATVDLLEVTPRASGVMVRTRVEVEVEDGQRPACVVDRLTLVVP